MQNLEKELEQKLLIRGQHNVTLTPEGHILKQRAEEIIDLAKKIKTFETSTRNTLDLASVAIIKEYYKIPIIVDPSHAAGRADIIPALSRASMASGADGLIIEVHQQPAYSISDSSQALDFNTFKSLYNQLF